LLAVLWLSAALATIAFAISATVRSETGRVSTSADGLRAWYLATGSVERGIQWMMWGAGGRGRDGKARFWDAQKPRLIMVYPSGDVVVEVIPESSKLNVNTASPMDLNRVLGAVASDPGQAAQIAAAIFQRRMGGGGPAAPAPGLGPASTFRGAGASFQEIEDLMALPGVTPEVFYGNYASDSAGHLYARGGLRDSLSVWGSASGPFDINTASIAILEAYGVQGAALANLLTRRQAAPFRTIGEVAALLGRGGGQFRIGGNSIFTLRATSRLRLPNGRGPSEVVRTASAVVKVFNPLTYGPGNVHVLRFYDDAWSQDAVAPPGPGFVPPGPLPGSAVAPALSGLIPNLVQ
jgi:general secretion pathway protein K